MIPRSNDTFMAAHGRGEYHELLKVRELNLRAKFVELLREHLKAASDNGENLLIMILGHGQADTGHLIVGDRGRPFTVKNLIKKFKIVPDVPVMLANDYNAVPFLKSIPVLTFNPTAKKSLEGVEDMEDDEEIGELSGLSGQQLHERTDSYAELTRTSYEALASIDRRAYKHQISFRAQDDDWSANGHVRTDPTLHLGDFLNQDPNVPESARLEYLEFLAKHREENPVDTNPAEREDAEGNMVLGKRSASGTPKPNLALQLNLLFKSYQSFVFGAAKVYMRSHPGDEDDSMNGPLHAEIASLMSPISTNPVTRERLESVIMQVQYRLDIMSQADKYVQRMGLCEPSGQTCQEFDEEEYLLDHSGRSRLDQIRHEFFKSYEFHKGSGYVCAAIDFTVDSGTLSLKECMAALEKIYKQVEIEIQSTKGLVKSLPEVQSQRQRVAAAFSKTLRYLSPVGNSQET
ncbi:uncharacterized protein L3040_006730 [Drepanopeziza brunnea f. sp. 'multigermtubi']|uniref:uncharacterized protein n=1 Tax=Drepanopeziza brunnea f. sp. 'multigermtubi' TaxID=698441 RepID=UPI0023A5A19A|nr:hypothetical protein L3040_006730 [Drepanopeziza brunnea f. sp. 'multigermtubi']